MNTQDLTDSTQLDIYDSELLNLLSITSERSNRVKSDTIWEAKFKVHFPDYYTVCAKKEHINWFDKFRNTFTDLYSSLSVENRSLFFLVKEGKLALSKKNLSFDELSISGEDNIPLVEWAIRKKNQSQLDYIYKTAVLPYYQAQENHKDNNERTLIFWCISLNQSQAELAQCLKTGNDIEVKDANNITPLIQSLIQGNYEAASFLIEKGADINSEHLGLPAISIAIQLGHNRIVKCFLKHDHLKLEARSYQGETPLMLAAFHGNEELVKCLLEKGADINAEMRQGYTALTAAVSKGHTSIVKYLLENDANPNVLPAGTATPLKCAADDGNCDIISLLLSHGAKIDMGAENDGITPVLAAMSNGQVEAVKLLLEHGPSLNHLDLETGNNLITYAAETGTAELINFFVKKGISPDSARWDGTTALMIAASFKNSSTLYALLENGANVNATNEIGLTALIVAITPHCDIQIVQKLLDQEADLNKITQRGTTALIHALFDNHNEVANLLLEKGADVSLGNFRGANPFNFRGANALMLAARAGNKKVFDAALSSGIDIDTRDDNDHTLLMQAVMNDHIHIVESLFNHGPAAIATVEDRNKIGETALLLACKKNENLKEASNKLAIVKEIISRGANVNIKENLNGMTPLLFAAQNGFIEVAKLLIENLANINEKSNNGATPLLLAIEFCHIDLAKFLIDAGADIHAQTNDGTNLLHAAAKHAPEFISPLLRLGISLEAVDQQGASPLMCAVSQGKIDSVKLLLENGANVNASQQADDLTPLMLAVAKGNDPIAKLLLNQNANVQLSEKAQVKMNQLCKQTPVRIGNIFVMPKTETKTKLSQFASSSLRILIERREDRDAREDLNLSERKMRKT